MQDGGRRGAPVRSARRSTPGSDGSEPVRRVLARAHGRAVLVLGIESSCDETGAALVHEDGRVASDVVQSQVRLHAEYGGVVPELASRDHVKNVTHVVREAMTRAGVTWDAIDGVAVTNRPGLVGALLVGVQLAKGLAWGGGKPLVGVDHLVGHLLAVFLRRDCGRAIIEPPRVPVRRAPRIRRAHRDLPRRCPVRRRRSRARRDARRRRRRGLRQSGEAPGARVSRRGRVIDRLARQRRPARACRSSRRWRTPRRSSSASPGSRRRLRAGSPRTACQPASSSLADVCASFQRAVTGVLASKLVLAAERESVDRVVLGGGVAANRELRARTASGARESRAGCARSCRHSRAARTTPR